MNKNKNKNKQGNIISYNRSSIQSHLDDIPYYLSTRSILRILTRNGLIRLYEILTKFLLIVAKYD